MTTRPNDPLLLAGRLIIVVMQAILGFAAVVLTIGLPLVFFLRDKIIDTVGEGDPFVPANAERLTLMGWLALAAQLLAIPTAGAALYIAKNFEEQDGITVDAGLDLSGVVLVVVLFILARVFRHGATMRDDLEGTV